MFGDMSHESWDSSVDSEQCNGEMNSITDADDSYYTRGTPGPSPGYIKRSLGQCL